MVKKFFMGLMILVSVVGAVLAFNAQPGSHQALASLFMEVRQLISIP